MQKILTSEEMREVDRLTTEKYGIPSLLLMENAAHAAARVVAEKLGGSVEGKSFLILCGKGNNGGDGAALARILSTQGAMARVVLLGRIEETSGDARINFEMASLLTGVAKLQLQTIESDEQLSELFGYIKAQPLGIDVVVDAIFGTGLDKPPHGIAASALILADNYVIDNPSTIKISLDIPSGLFSDSSEAADNQFGADATISFSAPKLANVFPPASRSNGELHLVNIGSPRELINAAGSKLFLTDRYDARRFLRQTRFRPESYKNKRGHALVLAGSEKYPGAAVLCANSCARSGVGLVSLATAESAKEAVSGAILPEIMVIGLQNAEKGGISKNAFRRIEGDFGKFHAAAIGSGLTSDEEDTRGFVRLVVEKRRFPVVIDADGLNSLSPFDMQGNDDFPLILTPHAGEMKRLLGNAGNKDTIDSIELSRKFAMQHNVILALKGERILIAAPDGKVVVNPSGNSGLGKAGNGDNLAGIILGFITQASVMEQEIRSYIGRNQSRMDIVFQAVVAAVYVAGLAGDIAEKKYGKRVMTASDVRECLADAFREVGE